MYVSGKRYMAEIQLNNPFGDSGVRSNDLSLERKVRGWYTRGFHRRNITKAKSQMNAIKAEMTRVVTKLDAELDWDYRWEE
jgi:hypothetical protein